MTVDNNSSDFLDGIGNESSSFLMDGALFADDYFDTDVASYTEPQAKMLEYLSQEVGLDFDSSFKILKFYCKSIVKGNGNYLASEELPFYRERLAFKLEDVYKKIREVKGKDAAIAEFTKPKKISGLVFCKDISELVRKAYVEDIMQKHGFVEAGIMSLLECVRKTKVLPCVNFIWLKEEDKCLWYALQSVGRERAFSEARMICSIWELEKCSGKPMLQLIEDSI
jgi:hypothetical protein